MQVFAAAVKLIRTAELMGRAIKGARIWGCMKHAHAGNVPANISKIAPNTWAVKLLVKDHPGFSWTLTDVEAFDWVHNNAR